MTHVDLFSGIGGFALAARWAGFETIAFCEIEPYCQKVLRKHWPDVPIHDDVRTFPTDSFRGCTLLTGGFPCQPFSVAGERRGKEDDRDLWPAMFDVVSSVRPRWVVGENTPGIVNLELDRSLDDLEGIGYGVWTVEIPACAVDAWHRRDRVWIIAHDDGVRHSQDEAHGLVTAFRRQYAFNDIDGRDATPYPDKLGGCEEPLLAESELLPNGNGKHSPQEQGGKQFVCRAHSDTRELTTSNCPQTVCGQFRHEEIAPAGYFEGMRGRSVLLEPKLVRDVHGIPNGLDRLRALGNAIVPQVAYPILKAIAELGD